MDDLHKEAVKHLEEAAQKHQCSFTVSYKFKKEKWFIQFGHLRAENIDFLKCSVDILSKIWNINPEDLQPEVEKGKEGNSG